jgi:hypothetical protein
MASEDPGLASPLDGEKRLAAAGDQLNLILGFFARADTKLSVVLGIDLSMLGLLSTKAPGMQYITSSAWLAATLFLIAVGMSLTHLYQGSFPDVRGGEDSLVFFREIAKLEEAKYVHAFSALSADDLARDLLNQSWRNAVILKEKFHHLRWAYIFMAWGIGPWAVALILFVRA